MFVLDGYNSIAFPVVMLTACVQLHVTHTQINTHVHTPNVDVHLTQLFPDGFSWCLSYSLG